MTCATPNQPAPSHAAAAIGDSFALGMLVMLVINLAQRCLGLIRNLGFCQYLSDAELGHWAMTNSFLIFAAPLVVLGLPGSFGKFTETFRNRHALGDYITRIALVSLIGLLCSVVAMLIWPAHVAWFIYGENLSWGIVLLTAVTFASQVLYNFAFDLAISLRQVRVVSIMQFLQSFLFLLFGILCLALYRSWVWLLPSFALACLVSTTLGMVCILRHHHAELTPKHTLSWQAMWKRIVPFAVALWGANLLTNSFEQCDRYLLLHWSLGTEEERQGLVGQYYCGRIIPNLLTSLALTLSGILLPYWSVDWETGNLERIQSRMRGLLSLVSLGFTGVGLAGLILSPWLFDQYLAHRYELAEWLMPFSLVQATWSGLALVAGSYLFCAEKAKHGNVILLVALVINVACGIVLIRAVGISGAIIATLLSTGFILGMTCWRVHLEGCAFAWRTIPLLVMPLVLVGGMIPTAITLAAVFFIAGRTNWLLHAEERSAIDAIVIPKLAKLGYHPASIWP